MGISPDGAKPDVAYTGTAGGRKVAGIQNESEASIKAGQRAPMDAAYGSARSNVTNNLFGGFGTGILGFVSMLVFALKGVTGGLVDLTGALKATDQRATDAKAGVDRHDAELSGLQDRTQKLEGVVGYAHGYVNGSFSGVVFGFQKSRVSNDIGPMVGVTRLDGAYYLGSRGLWVADAQLTINTAGFGVGEDTALEVRVYAPDGSLHYLKSNLQSTPKRHTLLVNCPFVVPTAGYYVELWIQCAAAREILGGSANTGLSVGKRSAETS